MCFNYDQRWYRSHICGARVFLLLATDDDVPIDTSELEQTATQLDPGNDPPDSTTTAKQLRLHALSGDHVADTFRVVGWIGPQTVHILMDGGSTHNFVQENNSKTLGLTFDPIDPFQVLVGSGQELHYTHVCNGVSIVIQNHTFLWTFMYWAYEVLIWS